MRACKTISKESATLKLQAYERLVLLTERIALPNLISRLNQPGISAYEMKLMLIENVKAEFDYNSTQQLYVTPVCWDAVRNLKEQNIMIINKVAAMLPPTASAQDLNKQLLELLMAQPNSSLHEMVAAAGVSCLAGFFKNAAMAKMRATTAMIRLKVVVSIVLV